MGDMHAELGFHGYAHLEKMELAYLKRPISISLA